jgi:3-dehydroquinate dehydratase-2
MTNKKLFLLHGANLNLLGKREPSIYGFENLQSIETDLQNLAQSHAVELNSFQTNSEADLINKLHQIFELALVDPKSVAIIINPGAFTHYSYALYDALKAFGELKVKIIEVHISNPHARESFRHNSVISPAVTGIIAGLGTKGYQLAFEALFTSFP